MRMVEILVVVSIVAFLIATMVNGYQQFTDRTRMNAAVENTITLIQKARSNTLAAKATITNAPSFYGLHFDKVTEQVTMFKANKYSDASKRIETLTMPAGIEIKSVATSSPVNILGGDVLYERLTGNFNVGNGEALPSVGTSTLSYGTVTLRSKKTGVQKTIWLLPTGYAEVRNYEKILAYVVDTNDKKLKIFDVTTPTSPRFINEISTLLAGNLVGLHVDQGYAYIVDGSGGKLIKVDVRDVDNLSIAKSVSLSGASPIGGDVFASEGSVYVITGWERVSGAANTVDQIQKYRASDLALSGVTASGNDMQSIYVFEGRAYTVNSSGGGVCGGNDTLSIFDAISSAPSCLYTSASLVDDARRVAIQKIGSSVYAYVLRKDGLNKFDVTLCPGTCPAPSNLTNSVAFGDSRMGFAVLGDFAYANGGGLPFSVSNIANTPPTIVNTTFSPGTADAVYVFGNYAYVAMRSGSDDGKLIVIDVTNPTSAAPIKAGDVCIAGSHAINGGSCATANDARDIFVGYYPYE